MDYPIIDCPQIARRATIEKGFIAFYDRQGKCLGRRDTDYVERDCVHTVQESGRGLGPWVQTLYMRLIWKPLAKLGDMNMTLA